MAELSYIGAVNGALREALAKDPRVIILGEDVGIYGGTFQETRGLYEEFGPERVIDTPISESGFIVAGVGAALAGLRPVLDLKFIDFALLAMDPIVNQAAKIRYLSGGQAAVPLVVLTAMGTTRSAGAQHSQSLHAWFVHVPGLKVFVPSTPADARALLLAAIWDDDPVVYIGHKRLFPTKLEVGGRDGEPAVGRAAIRREGRDITLIAISAMVPTALRAAERLAAEGISAEVVDPRTLVPLDLETLVASVRKTHRVVVLDEGHLRCGLADHIAASLQEVAFDDLDGPIRRLAAPDTPVPFAPSLERLYLPNEEGLLAAVRGEIGGRARPGPSSAASEGGA